MDGLRERWAGSEGRGVRPCREGDRGARGDRHVADRASRRTGPRIDLLHDFFSLCRWELAGDAGSHARDYLEQRGLPSDQIERCGLGVVPDGAWAKDALRAAGYSDREIGQSSVLSDTRWPGRLCGGWRDEWGRIGTLWARSLDAAGPADTRYLYLRGARRSGLPPYGLPWIVKQTPRPRELVLVEGLLDVHHLRARGIANVAALGGTGVRPQTFERLARLGFESVTLCLDRDVAGRTATARAVEQSARASRSPTILVVDPEHLAPAKDPDALVRDRGTDVWEGVTRTRGCGIGWRALELTRDTEPSSPSHDRREALAKAGAWLGSLPPRLALEQEDAVRAVAERCGYSSPAVERAFRARFWREQSRSPVPELARGL